jgi:hypothetical protein
MNFEKAMFRITNEVEVRTGSYILISLWEREKNRCEA